MVTVAHPRIDPISQFNDPTTTLDGSNCTMAAGAMLGELATGKRLHPGELRKLQSDQEGGTSIPDLARAWQKAYDAPLHWASADDGPRPPGRTGATITAQGAWELLSEGHGLVLQGLYVVIEAAGFGLQPGFRDGHAVYLDGVRVFSVTHRRQAYVIDPLGRAAYRGQWMDWDVITDYGMALGRGGFYAAWAAPRLPDSSTGDPVQGFTIAADAVAGTLTVSEAGHSYLDLETGKLSSPIVPGPAWTDRLAFGPVRLKKGIGDDSADRSVGYLIGSSAAFVLRTDCTFTATAGDCSGAVAAEHERVRAAAIKAAEAL